jgi:hypothetical protein
MTNNTLVTVDVSQLANHVRKHVPEQIEASFAVYVASDVHEKVPKPIYKTLYEESSNGRLVSSISLDLNIPDFLVGPQFQQGSSVFACGRAALEIVRIELARIGLPKEALDKLTTEDVTWQQVRLPFMFRFVSEEKAPATKPRSGRLAPKSHGFGVSRVPTCAALDVEKFKMLMPHYARFLGLKLHHVWGRHIVEYRQREENPDATGVVLIVECRPAEELARVDVILDNGYLKSHRLDTLNSWHNAYAENKYESIFRDTLRKRFCLDEPEWHLNVLPEEVYNNSPSQRASVLLREYVAGKNPIDSSCFGFEENRSESTKKTAVRRYRTTILSTLGIDINTPWSKEQHRLRSFFSRRLEYPGDFRPDTKSAQSCFCQATSEQLLNYLWQTYQNAGPSAD